MWERRGYLPNALHIFLCSPNNNSLNWQCCNEIAIAFIDTCKINWCNSFRKQLIYKFQDLRYIISAFILLRTNFGTEVNPREEKSHLRTKNGKLLGLSKARAL